MTGTWIGIGYQYDIDAAWDIVMTIACSRELGVVGTIEYPSLACGGELVRIPDEGATTTVREQITHDTNRICADGGTIRLAPIAPDRRSPYAPVIVEKDARDPIARRPLSITA